MTFRVGLFKVDLSTVRMQDGFINPIQVFAHEIMAVAKLSSAITPIKNASETLNEYRYISHEPSFNRLKGSKIYFVENAMREEVRYHKQDYRYSI